MVPSSGLQLRLSAMLPVGSLHSRLSCAQLRRWKIWMYRARQSNRTICEAARHSAADTAAAARRSATSSAGGIPQPGDELELTCSDLAFGGEGICRLEGSGFVVFVDRALPGERLAARVVQSKRSFAKATKLATLAAHDDAVEPVCEHFGPCGGCTLQNLAYDAQLAAKQRQVADLLARTAGVADVASVLRPAVGAPHGERFAYRNKMEFSFSRQAWRPDSPAQRAGGRREGGSSGSPAAQRKPARRSGGTGGAGFALGLHRPGSTSEVLPISRCHLQSDPANALLQRVQQLCVKLGLQPYDPRTGTGLLQDVVIRRGRCSALGSDSDGASSGGADEAEEYLVNITTARDGRAALAPLARALMQPAEQPQGQPGSGADSSAASTAPAAPAAVVGVVNSVSQPGRPTGERRLAAEHVLAGRGFLTERLRGLEFEVSANSFFQTNTRQAEVLYRLVADAAGLRPTDTVLDLYCGTGSIGLTLAAACARVVGVEVNPAAVRDAERNAQRNGVANAHFLQGDLQKLQLEGRMPRPDVVVVDPARPGLSPLVIEYLRACGARRVVYVSCNAATQARDIKALCAGSDGGVSGPYRLSSVQPVDLYPHTWHVETVAVLDAANAAA